MASSASRHCDVPTPSAARAIWQKRERPAPRWADVVDEEHEQTPGPQEAELSRLRQSVVDLNARIQRLEAAVLASSQQYAARAAGDAAHTVHVHGYETRDHGAALDAGGESTEVVHADGDSVDEAIIVPVEFRDTDAARDVAGGESTEGVLADGDSAEEAIIVPVEFRDTDAARDVAGGEPTEAVLATGGSVEEAIIVPAAGSAEASGDARADGDYESESESTVHQPSAAPDAQQEEEEGFLPVRDGRRVRRERARGAAFSPDDVSPMANDRLTDAHMAQLRDQIAQRRQHLRALRQVGTDGETAETISRIIVMFESIIQLELQARREDRQSRQPRRARRSR